LPEANPRVAGGSRNPFETQLATSSKSERKSAASKKPAARTEAKGKTQDGHEWLGGYAGRTMMPSTIFSGGLSGLLGWASLRFLPDHMKWETMLAGLGAIWVLQLVRWGYRVWLYRYRLTSEHLFLHRGLLYGRPVQIPRCQILKVSISANLLEKILGVGKVVIESQEPKDGKSTRHELEGVRSPNEFIQKIGVKKTK
jgi:hypothetical protein